MSADGAQGIEVSVGRDFVVMGRDRIDVSPDGRNVTADATNGFEVRAASGAAAQAISISADFNTVVLNGVTIERASDGHLVISAPGGIVKQASATNGAAAKTAALEVGDLDDGGVYVGLSAENGKPLHAGLADLPDYKTYEEALAAAEQLKSMHPTAHVPTPAELNKNLFENRNTGHLKNTFNTSFSFPASVYRSSASYSDFRDTAWVQWFGDGSQDSSGRKNRLPVRLVW